jgi:GNAT superfamily N-acetyltransferase
VPGLSGRDRTRGRPCDTVPVSKRPGSIDQDGPRRSGSVSIDALSGETVDDVAALIAREHRHARDRGVPLPVRYLDAAVCGAALRGLLSEGFSGFVAIQGALSVGVMCGRTLDGVGFVPAHGIAVDPGALDPSKVIIELFAELAPVLVADGARRVTVDHVDHERLAIALFDLGFGRGGVFAVRGTEPIDVEPAVEVRVGSAPDLDSIAALSHVEFLHRSTPPMYAVDQRRSLADTRAAHEDLLHDGAVHLLARRGGRDVGLLTIEHTTPAPRLCAADSPYIGPTATDPNARLAGVGSALVSASLAWARARGHDMISVDFDSQNPLSRPFWLGKGFRPTGHRLRRVLTTQPTNEAETSPAPTGPNRDT